jgi:hypothetical protein
MFLSRRDYFAKDSVRVLPEFGKDTVIFFYKLYAGGNPHCNFLAWFGKFYFEISTYDFPNQQSAYDAIHQLLMILKSKYDSIKP